MAVGHLCTVMCKRGAGLKRRRLAATAAQVLSGTYFWAQEQVLEKVDTFNYLESILSLYDRDWPMVTQNLHRERRKWGRFYYLFC